MTLKRDYKMKKLLTSILLLATGLANAQYPSDFSLKNLEDNYIKSKVCEFSCGSFGGIILKSVNLSSKDISFEIPVSATQLTAIELPFDIRSFNWVEFTLDGKETKSILSAKNKILIAIPYGSHKVGITAKIKNEQLRVELLEDPKYFENNSSVNASIKKVGNSFFFELENGELKKVENAITDQEVSKVIFNERLYEINRSLFLSDKWRLTTTITPINKRDDNKVGKIEVPLLNGESPLSSDLEIKDNKVQVSLGGGEFSWNSNIIPKEKLIFENKDNKNLETWSVYNENNWIYSYIGINPISVSSNSKYKNITTWIMWPTEKVEVSFDLPKISPGQLTNVEKLLFKTDFNENPLKHNISFVVNSSIGGKYNIVFEDKKVEVLKIKVGEAIIYNRVRDGILSLDLLAGENNIDIQFKSGENRIINSIPKVKFETNIKNANFNIDISKRWVLAAGGGDFKPAILLWGLLFGLVIISYFLSKIKKLPLSMTAWVLLLFGISQLTLIASIIIIGWFLAFAYRDKLLYQNIETKKLRGIGFNKVQSFLGVLSIVSILILISVVGNGLLSNPEIFVSGYNTNSNFLSWYIQSWDGVNNSPWVLSLPMTVYRGLMLMWGVWLAFSLMSWLKWMWGEYTKGGYWLKEKKETTIIVEGI